MYKNFGIVLVCISAFLYGIRYIAAAIYGSNSQSWSKEFFAYMLDYVGVGPLLLSWLSLAAGLFFIFFSGFKNRAGNVLHKVKENWDRDMNQPQD